MPNGRMLEELRNLASKDEIPTDVALRLMLGSMADLHEQVGIQDKDSKDYRKLREKGDQEIKETTSGIKTSVDQLEGTIAELSTTFENTCQILKDDLIVVKKNPFVVVGRFISDHPKWSGSMFLGVLIISNIWFIDSFRRAVLLMLHVPIEIIEILCPLSVIIPTPFP